MFGELYYFVFAVVWDVRALCAFALLILIEF